MTDLLFGNNNTEISKKLARRSLKSGKNSIAILAIMLSALLFTSLFTIALTLFTSLQQNEMRTSGSSAHGVIKHITADEYTRIASDDRIKATGVSVVFGYASGDCFSKLPTEVRYADENYARWTFVFPGEGQMPLEEKDMAASRLVLEAMGYKDARIGDPISLTFSTDTGEISDTFTLCGIWDGDLAGYRQTILLSRPYMERFAPPVSGTSTADVSQVTGYLDVLLMLPSSWHIGDTLDTLASDYAFGDRINVNSAYLMEGVGISGALSILAGILIIFTAGYLLIYNAFYISIAQDIRFYGMLKTLGATSRQLKKIVYRKAWRLCAAGIPLGLMLGWPAGRLLVPAIARMFSKQMPVITTWNPLIFAAAILFSVCVVFISCRKPARMAAKVSPVEAVKYVDVKTDQEMQKKPHPKASGKYRATRRAKQPSVMTERRPHRVTPTMLAVENLKRSKKKVIIVTLSFALSLVLLNSVYAYVTSFDFDKFVADYTLTDFTVADATVINNTEPLNTSGIDNDFILQAQQLEGLESLSNVYAQFINLPLDDLALQRLYDLAKQSVLSEEDAGNYLVRGACSVCLYGLDQWAAGNVRVLEGDLSSERWQNGEGIYVTPMTMVGSGTQSLYHPGDTVTLNQDDGNIKNYTVLAIIEIPNALRVPMYMDMGTELVLSSEEYEKFRGTDDLSPMKTVFNVDDKHMEDVHQWLKDYTENVQTSLDYVSKVTLQETFGGLTAMYRLVGGTLCAILALIGILNFINSMMTSILSRCREIAMLQSVGMTGRQVRTMLICEGVGYAVLGTICAVALSGIACMTIVRTMGNELSYFTWRFTLWPVALCTPPLLMVTALIPAICYKYISRQTVVERLRMAE